MNRIRSSAVALALAVGVLAGSGCAPKKKTDEVWSPPPKVFWSDLIDREVRPLCNGYVRLDDKPSTGRFPTPMAVSRVAMEIDKRRGDTRRSFLPPRPKNEFLMWNSAFDDQMAISEVFPIAQRDLGGGDANPRQVVAAFHALHAGIGLVYATNYNSETQTEMIGVLYECKTADPIAIFHVQEDSIVPPPEEDNGSIDLWEYDSRSLVRQKFKRLVYACLRELVVSDQHERIDAPEGWVHENPILPVEWPPRYAPGH